MAKENRARYAVLGMLHYGDMTGYEIRKNLDQMVGYFWQEPSASVYPALKALEADQQVTAQRETPQSGPARIRYTLTSAGRATFAAWLRQAPAPTAIRNEFALKLCFGGLAEPQVIRDFIAKEGEQAQRMEANLVAIAQQLPAGEPSLMWRLVLDYGRSQVAASANWCTRATEALKAASATTSPDLPPLPIPEPPADR